MRRLPAVVAQLRGRAARLAGASTSRTSPRRLARSVAGPYDVSLVEGSITHRARRGAHPPGSCGLPTLVTIGACATSGGVQALRNFADVAEYVRSSTPGPSTSEDAGQIDPDQRSRAGRRRAARLPGGPRRSCSRCSRLCWPVAVPASRRRASAPSASGAATSAWLVADGTPCLGPVTQAGCGALCPSYRRGCYGCFGPVRRGERARRTRTPADDRQERPRRGAILTNVQRRGGAVPPGASVSSMTKQARRP